MPITTNLDCSVCGCTNVVSGGCYKNRIPQTLQVVIANFSVPAFNGTWTLTFQPNASGYFWFYQIDATNTISAIIRDAPVDNGASEGCYWDISIQSGDPDVCHCFIDGDHGHRNVTDTNGTYSTIFEFHAVDGWCNIQGPTVSVTITPTGGYLLCCPERDLPDTLKVTFANYKGVSCLAGLTVPLSFDYTYDTTNLFPRAWYFGSLATGCAGCNPINFYYLCDSNPDPAPIVAFWAATWTNPVLTAPAVYGAPFVQCNPYLAQFVMDSPCTGESGVKLLATVTE